MQALTSVEAQSAREGFIVAAQDFFSLFGYLGIIIVLSLYWSADQLRFERLGLPMFPAEHHAKALHIWRSIEAGVGAFLRSELVQGILAGVFLIIGYVLMGVRYPVLLALWGVLARLIPSFGVLIAAIPLVFMGVGTSTILGFLPAAYTTGILIFLKMVVEPRFIRRQRYNSLSIILFVIAMAQVFGIIGVLLAPVLAVSIQILFQQLYPAFSKRISEEPLHRTIDLRLRLHKVWLETRRSLPHEDSVLLNRVNRLLWRVREYMFDQ
jgi:predicted PurR-regulated permease PerM